MAVNGAPVSQEKALRQSIGDARQRINLAWLLRLRWGAVIGQSLTVAAVSSLLNIALPLPPLWIVLMLTAGSNLLLERFARSGKRVTESLLGVVVALDIFLLTALLYYTGGSSNPFNFLYLVHISLAAVTLPARWIVVHLGLAFLCFGSLFWWRVPLVAGPADVQIALHGQGMAVAFVLAATFIVYFVHRVTDAFMARELELLRSRELAARNERLSSLATLAAGAAHELATPLATIAIVAKELERQLQQLQHSFPQPQQKAVAPLMEDTRLVRHQVERCRAVLTHMAADAGTSSGESPVHLSAAALLDVVVEGLARRQQVRMQGNHTVHNVGLSLPVRSVAQAIRQVIKNALEASAARNPALNVDLHITTADGYLRLEVVDHGFGMAPDVLARVGEPFYTTKAPGLGMGLGLFLTRATLEGIGGGLQLRSSPQAGTTASMWLPVAGQDAEGGTSRPPISDVLKLTEEQYHDSDTTTV